MWPFRRKNKAKTPAENPHLEADIRAAAEILIQELPTHYSFANYTVAINQDQFDRKGRLTGPKRLAITLEQDVALPTEIKKLPRNHALSPNRANPKWAAMFDKPVLEGMDVLQALGVNEGDIRFDIPRNQGGMLTFDLTLQAMDTVNPTHEKGFGKVNKATCKTDLAHIDPAKLRDIVETGKAAKAIISHMDCMGEIGPNPPSFSHDSDISGRIVYLNVGKDYSNAQAKIDYLKRHCEEALEHARQQGKPYINADGEPLTVDRIFEQTTPTQRSNDYALVLDLRGKLAEAQCLEAAAKAAQERYVKNKNDAHVARAETAIAKHEHTAAIGPELEKLFEQLGCEVNVNRAYGELAFKLQPKDGHTAALNTAIAKLNIVVKAQGYVFIPHREADKITISLQEIKRKDHADDNDIQHDLEKPTVFLDIIKTLRAEMPQPSPGQTPPDLPARQ